MAWCRVQKEGTTNLAKKHSSNSSPLAFFMWATLLQYSIMLVYFRSKCHSCQLTCYYIHLKDLLKWKLSNFFRVC